MCIRDSAGPAPNGPAQTGVEKPATAAPTVEPLPANRQAPPTKTKKKKAPKTSKVSAEKK